MSGETEPQLTAPSIVYGVTCITQGRPHPMRLHRVDCPMYLRSKIHHEVPATEADEWLVDRPLSCCLHCIRKAVSQ